VADGRAPEVLWLLEHEPVVTTGIREVCDLPPADYLASRGVDLVATERGGLATWHGPGQLVGYPILALEGRGLVVRTLVHGIEEGVIRWLAGRDLEARRRSGYPGIWLGRDKICAIGVNVQRGVSMHGFALNLTTDLCGFGLITPCGIADGGVTSLARVLGCSPAPWEVAEEVGSAVLGALEGEALTDPTTGDNPTGDSPAGM
jgi:lipoate-protein ligase B